MVGNKKAIHESGVESVKSELRKRPIEKLEPLHRNDPGDLRFFSPSGEIRITVKAKMGSDWPKCMGVSGNNNFLVLVDFQEKKIGERPDFYIINQQDSLFLAKLRMSEIRKTRPEKRMQIDSSNNLVFMDEICKTGNPYKGITVRTDMVTSFREKWEKINITSRK
jgi:hypothetical protein